MEVITLVILILLMLLSLVLTKKIFHPAVVFNLFWTSIYALYFLHLYGLYKMSLQATILFLLGMISYNVGCAVSRGVSIARITPYKRYTISKTKENGLFFISATILLIQAGFSIVLLKRGISSAEIRYGGKMNISYVITVSREFIAIPTAVAFSALLFAELTKERLRKKTVIYASSLAILSVIATFQTLCIYLLAGGFLIYILMMIEKNKREHATELNQYNKGKRKKILIGLTIVMIIGFFLLIKIRGISIGSHLYTYLTGSLVCMSEKLDAINSMGRNSHEGLYTYGLASLQGIVRPFVNVFEKIGLQFPLFDSASDFYWPYLAVPIEVYRGHQFNYFTTPFLFFYKDAGYYGVCMLSFLYGVVLTHSYKKTIKDRNVYSYTVFFFWMFSIFVSLMEAPLVRSPFAMGIIYIVFLRKQDKN